GSNVIEKKHNTKTLLVFLIVNDIVRVKLLSPCLLHWSYKKIQSSKFKSQIIFQEIWFGNLHTSLVIAHSAYSVLLPDIDNSNTSIIY
ncbi:MAG: hypothetical protein ACQES1_10065, partial [Bacteroidota bacterium]